MAVQDKKVFLLMHLHPFSLITITLIKTLEIDH